MRKALREKVSTDYAFANTKCTEIASRLWLCQKTGRNKIATRLGLGLNRAQRDSNKIRLEAYTERSESNPGRSLGIIE